MKKTVVQSLKFAALAVAVIPMVFSFLEPSLASALQDDLVIYQNVGSEISFAAAANDVNMSGTIAGLTGGVTYGTTTLRVLTNDSSGYTMTITASSSPAMQGQSQGGTIANYTPAVNFVPDFAYSVPTGEEFAYTVSASTTSDLAQKFLDNGSACNVGSSDTNGQTSCWYALSTTATTTIVRATETPASGATTTINFRVTVNSGSSLPEDTYVATTTLTVTTN